MPGRRFHIHVGLRQADLAEADGLDLATHQGQARLEPVEKEEVKTGLSIGRDDLHFFDHANHFSIGCLISTRERIMAM